METSTAKEFSSCNKNGKNNLFIKINDEFNKKFIARYKNNDLTLWQLKNTLSIVENLEASLKNIATEEKKNDLIALLDGIEKDVQNKFGKKAENDISDEITELVEKIKSTTAKVKNQAVQLDIQTNNNKNMANNYVTPKGFIEKTPEVIFVPYITILKNVFVHELNLIVIFIFVLAAIICAIKALWLFFGISAGIFLFIIIIDFVASIIKFKCVNKEYYLSQNNIYRNSKTLELPPNTIEGQHLKINLDQGYEKK